MNHIKYFAKTSLGKKRFLRLHGKVVETLREFESECDKLELHYDNFFRNGFRKGHPCDQNSSKEINKLNRNYT